MEPGPRLAALPLVVHEQVITLLGLQPLLAFASSAECSARCANPLRGGEHASRRTWGKQRTKSYSLTSILEDASNLFQKSCSRAEAP